MCFHVRLAHHHHCPLPSSVHIKFPLNIIIIIRCTHQIPPQVYTSNTIAWWKNRQAEVSAKIARKQAQKPLRDLSASIARQRCVLVCWFVCVCVCVFCMCVFWHVFLLFWCVCMSVFACVVIYTYTPTHTNTPTTHRRKKSRQTPTPKNVDSETPSAGVNGGSPNGRPVNNNGKQLANKLSELANNFISANRR